MRLVPLALIAALAACAHTVDFDGTPLFAPAPRFTLTDQSGRPWSLTQQRGKNVALYFGYTHCPDDCPLTLAKLAHAIAALGPAGNAEIALVTVDPERDTPLVLATYIRHFHGAKIVGLTGSRSALAKVYASYHVWAQRIPGTRRGANYEVAHASPVFLIDASGRLRVLLDGGAARSAFTHDLRDLNA